MMKKECIVHIGMHKTGTTSIQATLYKQKRGKNYCYFDINAENHSVKLYSYFSNKKHRVHQKTGKTDEELARINKDTEKLLLTSIRKCPYDTMVISGEDITVMSEDALEKMKNFLERYFEHITIVAYVRAPKSYIESAFQQVVKGGAKGFDIEKRYPSYQKRFEKFDHIFGKENVHLWKFDPKTFKDGDVVKDFCYRLGLSIDDSKIVRRNEAVSKDVLSLLYIDRKYGAGYGVGPTTIRDNTKLVKVLNRIESQKPKFSLSLIQPILEKNRSDLNWIEERIGEPLEESLSDSPGAISSEADLLMLGEESIKTLKELVGPEAQQLEVCETPQHIATLVNMLRLKITNNTASQLEVRPNNEGDDSIKLEALVDKIKASKKEKLGEIPDQKIAMIVREALDQIGNELDETEEGKIQIPRLGTFVSRIVEHGKEGKKVPFKRIVLRRKKAAEG